MTVRQEVSVHRNDIRGTEGISRKTQRLTKPLMSGRQFTVPGNQPVLLALTHW
jgi:hypothetical protein